jgi:hypothetical protein
LEHKLASILTKYLSPEKQSLQVLSERLDAKLDLVSAQLQTISAKNPTRVPTFYTTDT